MCLNKEDSEYASDLKCAKILIMAGLSICERVTQRSEYDRMCLDSVLNRSWVLNMPGF